MSIKIYDGYWMGADFFDAVLQKCIKARKAVCKRRNTMLLDLLKKQTDGLIEPMFSVLKEMKKRQRHMEQTKLRDPEIDYKVEASFFATKDKVLVMVFCENEELKKTLIKSLDLAFYGYWNNTDPDERCDKAEWKRRKRDWNKVLSEEGVPSHTSMSFVFSDGIPWLHELMKLPTDLQALPDKRGALSVLCDNKEKV